MGSEPSTAAQTRLTGEVSIEKVVTEMTPYAYGPTTPVSRIMSDERARKVLRAHLPEQAIETAEFRELVSCLPFTDFERVWIRHLAGYLTHLSEQEIEETLERVCIEFSNIEPD